MSFKEKMIAYLIFGVSMICTIIFGIGQFERMLSTSQGLSVTWFAFWEIFLVLNLVLAIKAHKNKSSSITFQTVMNYAAWALVIALDLVTIIVKNSGVWDEKDTITTILVGIGIAVTVVIAKKKQWSVSNPMVKGWLAIFFKAIPQLVLAYKIYTDGGAGLPEIVVWSGHVTIITRLGQLVYSIKKAGWDKNKIGSAISEVANEASWIIVTIVWILK